MCARRTQHCGAHDFAVPSTPVALLPLENDLVHADRASVLLNHVDKKPGPCPGFFTLGFYQLPNCPRVSASKR